MDLIILTTILKRVEAHEDVTFARFEIYDDESWSVTAPSADGNEGVDRVLHSGEKLSELPALLSSLK